MLVSRMQLLSRVFGNVARNSRNQNNNMMSIQQQRAIHFRSGALKPKPEEQTLGFVGVICAVIPGLFVGATISKNVANFLEENDLFVPSDDDDDDD